MQNKCQLTPFYSSHVNMSFCFHYFNTEVYLMSKLISDTLLTQRLIIWAKFQRKRLARYFWESPGFDT